MQYNRVGIIPKLPENADYKTMPGNSEKIAPLRLDKWLWCARFYKTRSIAADALKTGKVMINGDRAKSSKTVVPGDVLSIRKGPYRYTITLLALAKSRKSATDASLLYEESPQSMKERQLLASQLKAEAAIFPSSKGRPTKKDRRSIIKFRNSD